MSSLTLDNLTALNAELAALDRAGVSLGLDLGGDTQPLEQRLRDATAALAMRMARGASLDDAIRTPDASTPRGYCSLVRAIQYVGDAAPVLQRLRRRAEARRLVGSVARRALAYPLIVVTLAAIAILFTTSTLQPLEAGLYDEFREAPGPRFSVLSQVAALPAWWLPVVAAIVATLAWAMARNRMGLRLLPSVKRYGRAVEEAHFADLLALLLQRGAPLNAATELAQELSQSDRRNAAETPGLLQWTLAAPLNDGQRLALVDFARDNLWATVRRRAWRLQFALPAATCVLIGGVAVVIHGWLVFAPWSELLARLAQGES